MKKEKYKKIPISKFISDKELSKINKIIETSESVDIAYDRIELLLSDDFKVKGLGTNRLVLIHKKDKFKDLIFKVAGDPHGIEANYREFYNGDLDKRLTFSYSISDNGIFLVQEKVTVFDSKMMKDHKKEVRKILEHLSHKLLLVDCRISNFKNFGMRKNGDIVVLDHGDTVPLNNDQTDNIVNIDEESNVSLRCKRLRDAANDKLKPCGGKLEYSKDYEYLICKKCKAIMNVNDAYKEFYGDKKVTANIHNDFISGLDFDPKAWSKVIKSYAKDKMSSVNKPNKNNKGECEMKEKIINGAKCNQLKGYWIPESYLKNPAYTMLINSVKLGKIKPSEFVKTIGLTPSDYAVKIEDHTPNKDREEWKKQLPVVVNEIVKIINSHIENGNEKFEILYDDIEKICGFTVNTYEKEKSIYQRIIVSSKIGSFIYKKDRFIITLNLENDTEEDVNEDTPDNINELLGIISMDSNTNDKESDEKNDTYNMSIIDVEDSNDTDTDEDDNENDNEYINGDGTYNFDLINEDHDFSLVEHELLELISESNTYTERPGYSYKKVYLSDIIDILSKYTSIYDNLFYECIKNKDTELIKDFIQKCMESILTNYSFMDINKMKDEIEVDFVLSPSHPEYVPVEKTNTDDTNDIEDDYPDYDDDEEEENDDESFIDELDDDFIDDESEVGDIIDIKNDNLNLEEQSYENESKEDEELNDLKERVSNLERQVSELTNIIKEFISSNDSDKEESDDDNDDSDDDYSEDGNLIINADNIPDGNVIIFNKNGVQYRLDPSTMFIATTEGAIYDIIKATLQRGE